MLSPVKVDKRTFSYRVFLVLCGTMPQSSIGHNLLRVFVGWVGGAPSADRCNLRFDTVMILGMPAIAIIVDQLRQNIPECPEILS